MISLDFESNTYKELCWCGNPHEIVVMKSEEPQLDIFMGVKCECGRYVHFRVSVN